MSFWVKHTAYWCCPHLPRLTPQRRASNAAAFCDVKAVFKKCAEVSICEWWGVMRRGLGEVTYMHSISPRWWHYGDTRVETKNTQSLPLCLYLTHTRTHASTHTHTHTHTAQRTQRAGALSTRKETEIGNKDHPLCLRTVNGSSNVFNLSPESNNGAHSTPPRYCSTVPLKALGFHHPSLSQSPPPRLCRSWRD